MLMSASIRPNFAATEAIAASAAGAEVRSTPPTMSAPGPSRSARPSGAVRAWSMSATAAPRFAAVSATTLPSAPAPPVTTIVLPCIMASGRLLHRRFAGLELAERLGARLRRLGGARLLHVSVSADSLIGADDAKGDRMRGGGQALREIGDVGLKFGEQALLELALRARAERVEPGAAQEPEPRHDPERGHDPGARLALLHPPAGRIEARERPGAEMKMEPVGAFELACQRLMKLGRDEQARDFPLVLGGEQLVIGA